MALVAFIAELDELGKQAEQAFAGAGDVAALEAARVDYLGARAGRLKDVQKKLGGIDKADKPAAGKQLNDVKARIEAAFQAASERVASGAHASKIDPRFDPTLPGKRRRVGVLHPITQSMEDLKEIMGRLGFTAADGPEIEDEWHNFEALNIPKSHPARDPLENFYLSTAQAIGKSTALGKAGQAENAGPELLLRSQTSTVQIRVMERQPPPVRIISFGRVYRPDEVDATHYPMFHQMEGLLVDEHVTMADLKSVLRLFAASYLGADVHVRIRPSFFPFTEPSVEADYFWNGAWIEFGGAGMVDPNVLSAVGYDPEKVSGFAFGMGVERLCMRRRQITDIREFYRNDVRFLHQFA